MLDKKDLIFQGLAYTVMGILVVFLMLIIIMYVIKAMALFSSEKKEEKAAEKAEPAAPAAPVVAQNDDCELVAVITAAVACMMGTSASGLVIRSYKKVSGGAWNKAGRAEVLDNRF